MLVYAKEMTFSFFLYLAYGKSGIYRITLQTETITNVDLHCDGCFPRASLQPLPSRCSVQGLQILHLPLRFRCTNHLLIPPESPPPFQSTEIDENMTIIVFNFSHIRIITIDLSLSTTGIIIFRYSLEPLKTRLTHGKKAILQTDEELIVLLPFTSSFMRCSIGMFSEQ